MSITKTTKKDKKIKTNSDLMKEKISTVELKLMRFLAKNILDQGIAISPVITILDNQNNAKNIFGKFDYYIPQEGQIKAAEELLGRKRSKQSELLAN